MSGSWSEIRVFSSAVLVVLFKLLKFSWRTLMCSGFFVWGHVGLDVWSGGPGDRFIDGELCSWRWLLMNGDSGFTLVFEVSEGIDSAVSPSKENGFDVKNDVDWPGKQQFSQNQRLLVFWMLSYVLLLMLTHAAWVHNWQSSHWMPFWFDLTAFLHATHG